MTVLQRSLLRQPSHLGKTLSEEHKRKISEGNKGKIVSEETRRKIVKTRMKHGGYKVNKETRRKISESKKGKKTWNTW